MNYNIFAKNLSTAVVNFVMYIKQFEPNCVINADKVNVLISKRHLILEYKNETVKYQQTLDVSSNEFVHIYFNSVRIC